MAEDDEEEEKFDFGDVKAKIEQRLEGGDIDEKEAQVMEQRAPAEHAVESAKEKEKELSDEFVITGIAGLDEMFEVGIPRGVSVLVAGGTGSGKTILCLQILAYHASRGKKCLFVSFEESEERLRDHMGDFGWDAEKMIEEGNLKLQRLSTVKTARQVEGLLAGAKGELEIELEPEIIPEGYDPDFVVIDSLTAVASAFRSERETYRIYVEQLFRYFEDVGCTAFMITETEEMPEVFSPTGVEEFLADGVLVLYHIRHGDVRERAIEVLKMRGAEHDKKIVAMQITDEGIRVYPQQEVFGGLDT